MHGEYAPFKVKNPMDVDLFKQALRTKGLSPEALADEVGVGKNTPRRWMSGVEPLVTKAQEVAAFLDLTVDQLWPMRKAA